MAGNPFRRPNSSRPAEEIEYRDTTPPPTTGQTTKKRVTIQTPPRSPEDAPRRLSEGNISPPPPPQSPDEDEDSDSTATGELELEEAARNTRRNSGSLPPPLATPTSTVKAPYNPFARTLATTEAAFAIEKPIDGQHETNRQEEGSQTRARESRTALDVDEFKSILLTGKADPSPAVSSWQRLQVDNSSSTDTSSLSKHSLFDPAMEIHPETPISSIEHMELLESPSESESDSEEEDSNVINGADRSSDPAPPPPKQADSKPAVGRGPQNVSFSDFEESIRTATPSAATSVPPVPRTFSEEERPATLQRSASDLNKVLLDSSRKLPSAVEKASKISEDAIPASQPLTPSSLASENAALQKKAPPPLPAARRTGLERYRSDPNVNRDHGSTQNDELTPHRKVTEPSAKSAAPPPPPPSRKARPASQIATPIAETPPEAASPAPVSSAVDSKTIRPAPPPRNPSKPGSNVNRSSSNASHSSIPRAETLPPSLNAPPAPPPRRSGANSNRTSMDGRPPSLSEHRRGSEQSVKAERTSSPSHLQNVTESGEAQSDFATSSAAVKPDVLADLSAFQAEIDALRAKAFSNAG